MKPSTFPYSDVLHYLPLTETTFFILFSLAPQAKHGYAIMKAVFSMSEGRINLSAGTLYGALKRLLAQNWIERLDDDAAPDETGRPHKAYALTNLGKRILNAEIVRLRALVQVTRLHPTEERACD